MPAKCPTCGEAPAPRHRPFCSQRCAQTDLGRWLSGQYAVPATEEPDSGDLEELESAIAEAVEEGRLVPGEFQRGKRR